jgi:hypothetical protein
MIFLPRSKLASSQNVCYDRITEHDRIITRSASLTIGLPTTRLKLTKYDSWPTVKSKPELTIVPYVPGSVVRGRRAGAKCAKSERQRWVERYGPWSGKRARAKGGISSDARL